MEMFSQMEIFLMIGVVSVLLFIIIVLTILDIRDYKKNGKLLETDELQDDKIICEREVEKEEVSSELNKISDEILISDLSDDAVASEIAMEPLIEDLEEDVLLEEIEEPIVQNVIEPKEEKIITNEKVDLNEELHKALEEIPKEENLVTSFEEEQERTAIISLDELLAKGDEIYNNNEVMQYDDGNEPISIDEVISMFNKEEKQEPVLSSVYGIEKNNQSMEFENTATYEKLSRAKKNEFMAKLREINDNK